MVSNVPIGPLHIDCLVDFFDSGDGELGGYVHLVWPGLENQNETIE